MTTPERDLEDVGLREPPAWRRTREYRRGFRRAKVEALWLLREAVEAAEILRNGMGGHRHWDRTRQHGAGCETCKRQREACAEAAAMLERSKRVLEVEDSGAAKTRSKP